MIEVESLVKNFDEPKVEVLKNLTFSVESGKFVSITGRSGSGKSTLLYLISTLDAPTSGKISLDGRVTTEMSSEEVHRFRNQQMGFVFQFHYLLPELTALENVLMPARKDQSHRKRYERAKMLLSDFGLEGKEERLPKNLSGGEQQRVAIARALIMEPAYVFADEPTGNLDSVSGDVVMKILRRVSSDYGATVIYVTHDPDYAAQAEFEIQLVDGRVVNS